MNSKNETPTRAASGHGAETNKFCKSYRNTWKLSTQKQSIDGVAVAQRLGIALKPTGAGRFVCCCPFHEERTPSFTIYPDGKFYCFGCHARGDIIDLVQKLHGLNFRGALQFLGLPSSRDFSAADRRAIEEAAHKRRLVAKFRRWESIFADELGIMVRAIRKTLMRSGDEIFESDPAFFQWCCDELTRAEYHLEILIHGSDRDRLLLYKEQGQRHHMPKTVWEYEADRIRMEVTP